VLFVELWLLFRPHDVMYDDGNKNNGFTLWCNVLIRFCCTTVLLMTTGQSRVHYLTNLVIYVIFVSPGVCPI